MRQQRDNVVILAKESASFHNPLQVQFVKSEDPNMNKYCFVFGECLATSLLRIAIA